MRKRFSAIAIMAVAVVLMAPSALAATVYFQGFEKNTDGWDGATRVPSLTNGVTSATGSYHAETGNGFTRWGGYQSEFPGGGYTTSIDIYLNVAGGDANDTRFDFTSAVNNPDGNHRRDFAFNAGFYNDEGQGNRFVISASNNTGRSGSFPKNSGSVTISSTGWYTFSHTFQDDDTGVLEVVMDVRDTDGNLVGTWTLSNSSDIIDITVGGNRYGWFANNEFPFLAIDNTQLDLAGPDTEDECKNGGWEQFNNPSFENQGQCIKFVNTGE